MEIKQKLNGLKEKLSKIDWKSFIGTRAFITVGCVLLVCIAVFVSTLVNTESAEYTGESGENRVLGNTLLVDSATSVPESNQGGSDNASVQLPSEKEDFFAMTILNRTQARDSALEVLKSIADNPDTLPDAKEEALSSISAITKEMNDEANIEALIEAKGISKCVAVISGKNCSVIVNTQGLVAEELTQITDIVYEQAGIPVANITVVEAKG